MYNNYLEHHGIKGQKWGVRRYQNPDGTLTAAGRSRQNVRDSKADYKAKNKEYSKSFNKAYNYSGRHPISQYVRKKNIDKSDELWKDAYDKAGRANAAQRKYKQEKSRHNQEHGLMENSMRKYAAKMDKKADRQSKRGDSGFTERLHRDAAKSARTYKRYGSDNKVISAIGKSVVEQTRNDLHFYSNAYKNVKTSSSGKDALKGVGTAYKDWLNTPYTRIGWTGTQKVNRKQELTWHYKLAY